MTAQGPWEGPVPDFAADPQFVAAHRRAGLPDWFTLRVAAHGAEVGYSCDEVVRRGFASACVRAYDDLVVDTFDVACLQRGLPMLPVDRVTWTFA